MTHYETLGLTTQATDDDIKKAYRKLAMKHHPDRNAGNKVSEEKFKKINEAYATLSDSYKKTEYDYTLRKPENPNKFREKMNPEEFDDFVSSIFKRGSAFEDIFNPTSQPITQIELAFWEAIFGVEKAYEFNIQRNGKIQKAKVKIAFPPGTNSGDTFEVKAEGNTLHVQVIVSSDTQFRRENLDLYTEIDIPMTTAILGGSFNFEHWASNLEINIPAGIKQKQIIRLSNCGVKKGIFVGDLYLICNIILPKKINTRQRELLEEFAKIEDKESNKKAFGTNFKEIWNKFFKAKV